jgi:hypothetical protein
MLILTQEQPVEVTTDDAIKTAPANSHAVSIADGGVSRDWMVDLVFFGG